MKKYFSKVCRCVLVVVFFASTVFPTIAFAADEILTEGEITTLSQESTEDNQPEAGGVTLSATNIISPGTLEMQMNIVEGLHAVGAVELSIEDINGNIKTLTATAENITGEGALKTLRFPVDKMIVKGEYEVKEIRIFDTERNVRVYEKGVDWPFGELKFTVAESETDDNIAPVLQSVAVRTPEISSPGTLELDIGILEEGVGVKYIRLESNFWWDDFVFEPKGEALRGNGDPQTITFQVPGSISDHKDIQYHIISITICDNNDNKTVYTQGKPEWAFGDLQYEITKTPHDEAPEIKTVSVKTPEVTAPGVLELDMSIAKRSDDTVKYLTIELKNEKGGRFSLDATDFHCRADGTIETVSFSLPSSLGVGKWSIRYLMILGSSSGMKSYIYVNSPDEWGFGALDFVVKESERVDYDIPVLKSLSVRTPEVSSPGTLELDLGILEEGSGCSYIWIKLEEESINLDAEIEEGTVLKGDGTPQTVSFQIPEKKLEKQTYTIESIWLWDASGNYKNYYCQELGFPQGGYPQFMVTRTSNDDAPTITSAVIRNTSIALPGTLEMDMSFGEAKNDVKAVELSLMDSAGILKTVAGDVPESGGQTYSFALDESFAAGSYEVTEVSVTDSADTVTTYGKDDPAWAFGELKFEATRAESEVDENPALQSATIKTQDVLLPGTLEMDMVFGESKNDVKAVELSLMDSVGASRMVEGSVPEDGGQTYSFALDESFAAGTYEVTAVSVTDSADTVTTYGKDDPAWAFGELCFAVSARESEDHDDSEIYYVPFAPLEIVPIDEKDVSKFEPSFSGGESQHNVGSNAVLVMPADSPLFFDNKTIGAVQSLMKNAGWNNETGQMTMDEQFFMEDRVREKDSGIVEIKQYIEEASVPLSDSKKEHTILPYALLAAGCALAIGIVIRKQKTQDAK